MYSAWVCACFDPTRFILMDKINSASDIVDYWDFMLNTLWVKLHEILNRSVFAADSLWQTNSIQFHANYSRYFPLSALATKTHIFQICILKASQEVWKQNDDFHFTTTQMCDPMVTEKPFKFNTKMRYYDDGYDD